MTEQEYIYKRIMESHYDSLIALPLKFRNLKNNYMINNYGQVWHKEHLKLKSTYLNDSGYPCCSLTINGKDYTVTIHRLVVMTFIPNPENKPCVNHINGNKENNSVKNLEWVTHKENTKHAIDTGLFNPKSTENRARGINAGKNIYNEKQIREVCELLQKGYGATKISRMTDVSADNIWSIKNGENWKHISCIYDIKRPKKRIPLDEEIAKKAKELSLNGLSIHNIMLIMGLDKNDKYLREQIAWIRRKALKRK